MRAKLLKGLTEEQLGAVTGGCAGQGPTVCPRCGSTNTSYGARPYADTIVAVSDEYIRCEDCGYVFS